MSPEKQRIAIATACPTVFDTKDGYMRYRFDHQKSGMAVDPLNDLNAMHEAEKSLGPADSYRFADHLKVVVGRYAKENYRDYLLCEWFSLTWLVAHATSEQRAEAFLRTLNLWEEE